LIRTLDRRKSAILPALVASSKFRGMPLAFIDAGRPKVGGEPLAARFVEFGFRDIMSSTLELPTLPTPPRNPQWLLDQLLEEQQSLTAVERFSAWHATDHAPADARLYRNLIPLAAPGPGEQYAFEVDLDACSGCKACVAACHNLNGLEEGETWREVGLLVGGTRREPVAQHVTTACHHCLEPGCLAGCPVLAYDKDPLTGIVRHLDDQCIGCQYCVLMCPYEAPKYSAKKGIVRKCDMCRQRLKVGEAPACVQSCPNEAIRISLVSTKPTTIAPLLPAAPDSAITKPTTRFLSQRGHASQMHAADEQSASPAHAHWPLVAMLVLTQASVGMLLAERCLSLLPMGNGRARSWLLAASTLTGLLGGQSAIMHLGRPLGAWRAWMGWKTSWLSREIISFGVYGVLSVLVLVLPRWNFGGSGAIAWLELAVGLYGVFCSAMIYAATRRAYWELGRTLARFAATMAALGITGALAAEALAGNAVSPVSNAWWLALLAASLLRLRLEADLSFESGEVVPGPLGRTSVLLQGPLRSVARQQRAGILLSGLVAPCVAFLSYETPAFVAAMALCALATRWWGEICERVLFFRAEAAPRMPGGLPA
jgi:Fe-S-cluster-containing dehydrogenase component/DMSO reductase anchor subunit